MGYMGLPGPADEYSFREEYSYAVRSKDPQKVYEVLVRRGRPITAEMLRYAHVRRGQRFQIAVDPAADPLAGKDCAAFILGYAFNDEALLKRSGFPQLSAVEMLRRLSVQRTTREATPLVDQIVEGVVGTVLVFSFASTVLWFLFLVWKALRIHG